MSDEKNTYAECAYLKEQINAAVRAAGYKSFKRCVAELTTLGFTLTDIAKKLALNPQRFWAYYQQWCLSHAEPLRLGDPDV